jgi:predicted phage baseplate assembly protein
MPLPPIQLDDRTFEQLATELRRRIPAYTPKWTDHNESDPGITLMQLFAWLGEMIIYRLNQVPEKNYQAFLEMVGIDPELPTAATTELTFTISRKGYGVVIQAGTQVQASGGSSGPVVFTTDEDLFAVGLTLQQVQVYDGARYTVIPADRRAPGKSFAALSNQPQPGAALYLGFGDDPFPQGPPHRLTIHAAPLNNSPIAQAGADLTGGSLPPVVGVWEYFGGDASWQSLDVVLDNTNCLTVTGIVKFNAPAAGAHKKTRYGALQRPEDPELYWLRYRFAEKLGSGYESEPQLEDILINTVTATNAVIETDELLGASSGLPNQTFTLAKVPVLPWNDPSKPGIIAVNEDGVTYEPWNEVPNFAKAGPSDKVYTIKLSTGVVSFGDGKNGKIPAFLSADGSNQFASDSPNIKATSYQWGGGAQGNVGANTVTAPNSTVAYLDSVTNSRPASGGQDEETVAEAADRAPAVIRSQYRAVTASDFADLAIMAPAAQIVRAHALPLHHPTLSVTRAQGSPATGGPTDVPFPGIVTVLVIPRSTDPKPVPSAATIQLVANHLEKVRLITTEVYVKGPDYRKVEVAVQVIANPRYLIATVSQTLNTRLLDYFHPVKGGENGTGWGFGQGIYAYETVRQILLSDGVVRIVPDSFKTYVDDVLRKDDVLLGPSETVYSAKHTVTVTYT